MGMSEDGYTGLMERIEVAENLFAKEDFEKYVELLQETYHFYKKVSVVKNGERQHTAIGRLNADEEKRDSEVMEELNKYEEKIDQHFTYTFEQAGEITGFLIKRPSYIPKDHVLISEEAKADATVGKTRPLITMRYEDSNVKKGQTTSDVNLGFRLHQSGIFDDIKRLYGKTI